MQPLGTFIWGFTGSASVELLTLLSFYYRRPIHLPARYKRVGFWITRTLLAVLAGGIAVGYDIHQGILAFNVGAATPLIIGFMARGLRPGSTASDVLAPMSRTRIEEGPAPKEKESDERTPVGPRGRGPSSGAR